MRLENIVSVSGMGGLQKLLATRNNGLLIENFENGKRQFVSVRKHQFTPLATIGIYTYTDVVNLEDVLMKMHELQESNPIPDPNDKSESLRAWFKTIISEHDEDRVHINDIRKLIKWYNYLRLHAWDLVTATDEEE